MKFSEDYAIGTNVIRAFNDSSIDINNKTYDQSLLVGSHLLVEQWGISHIDDLTDQHWQDLLQHQPEVILVGTGKTLIFPHPSTYAAAIKAGIGVEFMDTAAACRTYNVLVSEDRRVIAGIIL